MVEEKIEFMIKYDRTYPLKCKINIFKPYDKDYRFFFMFFNLYFILYCEWTFIERSTIKKIIRFFPKISPNTPSEILTNNNILL